jgi:hypothetical protein
MAIGTWEGTRGQQLAGGPGGSDAGKQPERLTTI